MRYSRVRARHLLEQTLFRLGIYSIDGEQVNPEQKHLADSVRRFLELKPTISQIEDVDLMLHKVLLGACQTASTNIDMSPLVRRASVAKVKKPAEIQLACKHCGKPKGEHMIRHPSYPDIEPPGCWCPIRGSTQYDPTKD